MDRAILVTIDFNDGLVDYHENELKKLAQTNDITSVYFIRQKLTTPKVGYYVGKGKLDEIKMAIDTMDATIVIFNDELSPSQIRNLESYLNISVIDRSMLILNIFASRAKTNEAMIEVELAQLKYMLPRLVGLKRSLSRQGGGFNAKGPGEKQIELDRRKIEKRIHKLNEDLKKIMVMRKNRRKNRTDKVVCLVGYTNAGKSSLMNALINSFSLEKKTVEAEDLLFKTLTTQSRNITINNDSFILTDTVGFVDKLPHHLVNSFKSTLEEILDADLLIHVVDASNSNYNLQIETTNNVLSELKALDIPMIYAFNKADLLDEQFFPPYDNSILISTKDYQNINLLANMIKERIFESKIRLALLIPFDKGNLVNYLIQNEKIIDKNYINEGYLLIVDIHKNNLKKYEEYIYKTALN